MAKVISQFLFVVMNCLLVNGGNRAVKSPNRPFGPQRCVELCKYSGAPFWVLKEYRCRRISANVRNNKGIQTNEDLFTCVETKNVIETTDRPITSETAKNKSDHRGKLVGPHGIPCESDSVCKFPGATCLDGLCHCTVGHYFDPKTNTCVSKCDVYEDEMVVYRHTHIKKNNKRAFWEISQKDCRLKCLNETSFVCLTAEHGTTLNRSHVCYLSDIGLLDVGQELRENWNFMFSLIQRTRCQ